MSRKLSVPFGIYANVHAVRLEVDSSARYRLDTVVVNIGGLERSCQSEQLPGVEKSYGHVFGVGDQPHLFNTNVLRLRFGVRTLGKKFRGRTLSKKSKVVPERDTEIDFYTLFQDEIHQDQWVTYATYEKRLVLHDFDPGITMSVTYEFHFFGKDSLPGVALAADVASDLLSPSILTNILTGIVKRLTKAVVDVHPIAAVVVLAFNLAAQYVKAKQEYQEKFRSLLDKACEMLQALADTHFIAEETEDDSGLVAIVSCMHAVVEVADYARWVTTEITSRSEIREQQMHTHVDRLLASFDECEKALNQARLRVDNRREMIDRIQQHLQVDPSSVRYTQARDGPGRNRVKGTFEAVLQELHFHVDNGEPVVWVVGPPGCGKTTLMGALRTQLHQKGDSTATFYFPEHGEGTLGQVWSTLSYQIVLDSHDARATLSRSLTRGVRHSSLSDQFRERVMEPLLAREAQRRLIVIIDGVDKALFNPTPGIYDEFAQLLHTFDLWRSESPPNCTLVIASRDLHSIRKFWEHAGSNAIVDLSRPSHLHAAAGDVTRFLRERLGGLRQFSVPHILRCHPKRWPGEDDLDTLAQHADGSFLWASAAKDYIAAFGDKEEGLNTLLRCGGRVPVKRDAQPYVTYMHVLQHAYTVLDTSEIKLLRRFFGALLVFKTPPSLSQLVQLEVLPLITDSAGEPRRFKLRDLAKRLGVFLPFVRWEEDGDRIRICHDSFAVMLQSQHRYTINAPAEHGLLLRALLRWLNRSLHFDMGGIESSHSPPSSFLPLDPLFAYIIRHLPVHLRSLPFVKTDKGQNSAADILSELQTFFFHHFLHWLEVASLLGVPPLLMQFLSEVHSWIKNRFPWSPLLAFLADARSFCSTFEIPIFFSPAHIYLSALPFCLSTSKISQTYLASFPNTLRITERASRYLSDTRESTLAVGFSRSGQRMLSGTSMCTIYQWDLDTGAQLIYRQLVKGVIAKAMAFSPNGTYVALAIQPNAVMVYDLRKFRQLTPWSGYPRPSMRVCGPQGTYIVHLVFFPTTEQEPDRLACLFSRVVGSSFQSFVRIVNLETQHAIDLDTIDTSHPLTELVASPNSMYVMARTHHEPLASFCSGERTRIFLSRDAPGMLHVWELATKHAATGERYPFRVSSSSSVRRAAWQLPHGSSPNANAKAAFAVGNGQRTCFDEGHHDFVAVSPPVAGVPRVAAASKDMNVYVWDSDTGALQCVLPSLTKHLEHEIIHLQISRDGARLVSSSSGGAFVVWDISEKQLLSQVGPDSVIPVTLGPQGRQTHSCTIPTHSLHTADVPHQLYACLNEQSAVVLDDLCRADTDGWVCTKEGHRLFWVPPADRHGFWWPRMISANDTTIQRRWTSLDFRKFVHGSHWLQCQKDSKCAFTPRL